MIPKKVKDYLDEYVNQEVYVQIAIIKGKEKVSTQIAIEKYFKSNHFLNLAEGKPYDYFIERLKDKCLSKLKNSPMRNKPTDDEIIKELQNKLNNLKDEELDDTYWEIETGDFLSGHQIKELENHQNDIIDRLDISKDESKVFQTIINFCKNYEELCQKKYPEAPLPLEILKSIP